MQVSREYILELDKKRLVMENEIMKITEYLESNGMPGVHGKLIDDQGFPITGVDLMAVRTARNKLISNLYFNQKLVLQNDLSTLMKEIETQMNLFFENQSKNVKIENKKEDVDISEPITISVAEDQPKIKNTLSIPFAWVGLISEGSPAEEAGLKIGDGIVSFDKTLYYGLTNNPLQKIAEIVSKKTDCEIPVEVLRKNKDENGDEKREFISLTLVPHKWSGQGVLG